MLSYIGINIIKVLTKADITTVIVKIRIVISIVITKIVNQQYLFEKPKDISCYLQFRYYNMISNNARSFVVWNNVTCLADNDWYDMYTYLFKSFV